MNPLLIARIFEVEEYDAVQDGETIKKARAIIGGKSVKAPLIEGDMQIDANWESPFENSNVENKSQSLAGLAQSGQAGKGVDDLSRVFGAEDSAAVKKIQEGLKSFEGRSGISKLNSVQTFSGVPPIKIQATLLFRAWTDGYSEVEAPVNQLVQWTLPKKMAASGTIVSIANQVKNNDKSAAELLLVSERPTILGITYKGRTFMPMVLESVGIPITSPINSSGSFVQLQVPITLCSLYSLDAQDWKKSYMPLLSSGF